MKYIKTLLLITMGVLLLDSCVVVPNRRGMGIHRRSFFLYPPNRGYRKIPNYHPQPRRYYNPNPQNRK